MATEFGIKNALLSRVLRSVYSENVVESKISPSAVRRLSVGLWIHGFKSWSPYLFPGSPSCRRSPFAVQW